MPQHGDETRATINLVLQQRRKSRRLWAVMVVLALAFVWLLFSQFNHNRGDELSVMGPVYTPQAISRQEAAPPAAKAPSPAAAKLPHRPAGQGNVEIVMGHSNAIFRLDDITLQGNNRTLTLQLSAGKHVIVLQENGKTQLHKLFVVAGEAYRVELQHDIKVLKKY